MKIVYCISGTYNSGGMERVLSNKANYLALHGYDVIIITTDQRGRPSFFAMDNHIKCIDLNVNYELNNEGSFFCKLLLYPYKQFKHKIRLAKVLNQIKPDIVVSMFCNDVTLLPFIKDGSKKILEVHFSRFKRLQYGRKGLWRLADKWRSHNEQKQISRYDKFVVLTYEDKKNWGDCTNIDVIPNAQTFVRNIPVPLRNKIVVAVGRYTYQKGFDMLLQAWKIVCNQMEGWQLHIVGDGELKGQLAQQIVELSLENNVKLIPATTNIQSIYCEASILVLSSRYEGLPMVLIDAQTMGLPVVCFDCKCGPSEIVADGVTGFLVPVNDVTALAEKILVLIHDETLRKRMGLHAFNSSIRFSEKTIMQQWLDLFEHL